MLVDFVKIIKEQEVEIQLLTAEISKLRGRGFVVGENYPDVQELQKEIKSLRMILANHGEICEMNHTLSQENRALRNKISNIAIDVLNDDRDMKIKVLTSINEDLKHEIDMLEADRMALIMRLNELGVEP